ncbi:MAG: T9SS C-terminal target domain-containing protein [Saprospirales bacterium]|nr:MAG: T9SS C-terminal target domain-containing protein [Saprospirales bacterium]
MLRILTFLLFAFSLSIGINHAQNNTLHVVEVSSNIYTPAEITIQSGDTIRWINVQGTHNVNGLQSVFPNNPEGFFSGAAQSGNWEYEFIFTIPGQYDYQCDPHVGFNMFGVVIVDGPPVAEWIDPPADTTISCEEAANWIPGELEYSNNASGDDEISGTVEGDLMGSVDICGGQLTASWSFTDEFDRTIEHTQQITVIPAEQAEWVNAPENLTISCEEINELEIVELDYTNSLMMDCEISGSVSPTVIGDPSECGITLELIWEFTDVCGRTIEHVQQITIEEDELTYTPVMMSELRENDSLGAPVLLGDSVSISAIVYGINLRPAGLEFTIIDENNVGVGIFNPNNNFGYTVQEGDLIEVRGVISQFRGLTQIVADEIDWISENNELVQPLVVSELNEGTESALIMLEGVTITNPEDWPNPGSAANLFLENEHGTFEMRIQSAHNLGNTPPEGEFDFIGIGGQFTTNVPADDGYRVLPRYKSDLGIEEDEYMLVEIPELRENNPDFEPVLLGEKVQTTAVVYGVNLRPQGLEFTIIDENNVGVGVFRPSGNLDYEVNEGDMITVRGTVSQFRGLTQINADEIELISENNELVEPIVIAELGENTESSLVKLEAVTLLNPEDWPTPGTSANLIVENQDGQFEIRVAAAVNLGFTPPEGEFDLIGIGSQFTTNTPPNDGYRIMPRYAEDLGLDLSDPYTEVTMPQLRENDPNGRPLLLGQPVSVTAVVYGINFRPQGLQFTLIDEDNVGVSIYRASGDLGYIVNEGDLVLVKGIVEEFRGLTQINPDEIELISQGNELVEPRVVTALGEETESSLIKLENLTILNPEDWPNPGSSANINIENEAGTFLWRIQVANDLGQEAPMNFDLVGIGAQFTTAVPAEGGYQIIARYADDIMEFTSVDELSNLLDVIIWPVPTSDYLFIEANEKINSVRVFDMSGKLIKNVKGNSNRVSLSLIDFISGNYLVEIWSAEGNAVMNVIVK